MDCAQAMQVWIEDVHQGRPAYGAVHTSDHVVKRVALEI